MDDPVIFLLPHLHCHYHPQGYILPVAQVRRDCQWSSENVHRYITTEKSGIINHVWDHPDR